LAKKYLLKPYSDYLKKKWSWKRFRKKTPKEPDAIEYQEKKSTLEHLILLFLAGYIDLRFGDESAFNLEPNVPYGWIRQGEQRGIPSRKGGNLNVFGLLNLLGELTTFSSTGNINSQAIIDCLDEFVLTIKKLTIIVLDNAPWHVSKEVESKIKEWESKGLIIFYLPPYSPHLNIIETLWRKVKLKWLKPEDFENKEKLHEAIKNIFKNYNNGEYKIDFTINLSCYDNFV
jgi:Transposase and inactivated derivatives